jgi:cytochrome c oxidase subunit 2
MWNFPLIPDQASTNAGRVDAVMLYELGVTAFFTILICLLIIGLAIRYRRGHKVDRSNPPESSKTLEALWIGVPLVLSAVMFYWGARVFYELFRPPGDASSIYVVGKQWMWYIQHPEGRREINELHVPVGRAVKLRMTSQDVIHSFFVPAFRVKQDVLPGRYTETWFRPTKPGQYHIFCAEYCGTNHSTMRGTVTVMDPAAYERWLTEGQGGPTMAEQGKELFIRHHCAGCHGGISESVKAPRLEGIYGRPVPIETGPGREPRFVIADDRYIRDSILLPKSQVVAGYNPIMPSFQGQISEDDLLKIIEYIKSIGGEAAR